MANKDAIIESLLRGCFKSCSGFARLQSPMALSACIDDRANPDVHRDFGLRALGLFARAPTDDQLLKHALRENERLRQENRQLRGIVDILNRKIETLEEEIAGLKKKSRNSSKPPSSDIVPGECISRGFLRKVLKRVTISLNDPYEELRKSCMLLKDNVLLGLIPIMNLCTRVSVEQTKRQSHS